MKLLLILLLCAFVYSAEKLYGNVFASKIISVYDGDTFTININSWPTVIGKEITVRIYGIDTPEMKDKDLLIKAKAVTAKLFVTDMLTKAKKVKLCNLRRDKYFRLNAEVFADGKSVADTLIKLGLAKPYFGETKETW